MARKKKPQKRKAHEGRSAILLHARLRGGAGAHRSRPTRSAERRQAIAEAA